MCGLAGWWAVGGQPRGARGACCLVLCSEPSPPTPHRSHPAPVPPCAHPPQDALAKDEELKAAGVELPKLVFDEDLPG